MHNQLRWLWLSAFVFLFDQASKFLIKINFIDKSLTIFPVFNISFSPNRGAAFGFLNSAGGWQRWLFIIIALAISAFILQSLSKLAKNKNWEACALALILGGALGNLYDRIIYSYVIDFLQVHYQNWYFPTFNLADSAITLGVIIWLIIEFKKAEK